MKKTLIALSLFLSLSIQAQEVISPIAGNPSLYPENPQINAQSKSCDSLFLDSTFIYSTTNLEIEHVWDDFSVNKFVKYPPDYSAANVTSQWYWCLMNSANTIPEPSTVKYCDVSHARHDSIFVVSNNVVDSVVTTFTPHSIWVNDLTSYPISGTLMTLYDECYVLRDSVIDGVPDSDQDTLWYINPPDYDQDSIHLFFANLNDTNNIWLSNSACHNYRFPVDPWSLGVVTFDGVDSTGRPYQFGNTNAYGQADVLTSKPVNLLGKTQVFLQFLYQPQGHGNMPEDQDSLIVDFYLVDSAKWYPWWYATPPYTPNQWDTAFVAVPVNFLDNGFQFRFRNYASLSGALDHWHVDYVQLYENPLLQVQPFKDLAIAYPLNTLLDDYTSVPWDHYVNLPTPNDQMADTTYLFVYNSDVDATNVGPDMFLEIKYNGTVQGNYNLPNPGGIPPWTSNWELGMNAFPFFTATHHNYFDAPGNDTMAVFDVKINAHAAVAASNVYDVNDTTYMQQVFKNYYAYDDGSAEVAYGIQGANSQLAYKFDAYEADTLTGVLFHFVPSVNDVSNKIMLLTVWDDNNGEPGNILYQDNFFLPHYPSYGGSKNEFKYYEFVNPDYPSAIPVDQTFYVGWEQIDSESLNIGMDRNIVNNSKIFYNVGGSWNQSSQPGSLMIRPVFSTAINHTLSIENNEPEPKRNTLPSMYPNPATNAVTFTGLSGTYNISFYDMSGRLVLSEQNRAVVDITSLQKGVYFVDVRDQSGISLYTNKLIKN
ncbi:MAG: T9SS type A sorting domain-containing protein [Crocinitomicaceae bacterium]|nr:T9SS type A sorting domain-containing protein [Crocinitomicaceae bacterium]